MTATKHTITAADGSLLTITTELNQWGELAISVTRGGAAAPARELLAGAFIAATEPA